MTVAVDVVIVNSTDVVEIVGLFVDGAVAHHGVRLPSTGWHGNISESRNSCRARELECRFDEKDFDACLLGFNFPLDR